MAYFTFKELFGN